MCVIPKKTEGTTGSTDEDLAFTGIGVMGPFTIMWPVEKNSRCLNTNAFTHILAYHRCKTMMNTHTHTRTHTLTQIVQEFLGSVLSRLEVEKLLVLINKLGVNCGVQELAIAQYILKEGDISLKEKKRERGLDNQLTVTAQAFMQYVWQWATEQVIVNFDNCQILIIWGKMWEILHVQNCQLLCSY